MTLYSYHMIRKPSVDEIDALAEDLDMDLSTEEAEDYTRIVEKTLADYETIQEIPEPQVGQNQTGFSERKHGSRLEPEENRNNAWITTTEVSVSDSGPLAGARVGLKDSISLEGVEMTCGSHLLEGYTPNVTATVVQRILDAGGTILGKNNMDSFGFSSSGDLSDFGAVTNPHDSEFLAGGSSSGCAAALANDEIDVALGCDQGGAIRIPAASCGVVGLDPTTGLVPYTGIFPMDPTIDHVGPMAQSVEDVAKALEVIAGPNGLDSRQPAELEIDEYTDAVDREISDMTIAVLEEGFDHPESHPGVDSEVRDAIESLEQLGAETKRVSIPIHLKAPPVALLVWGYGSLQIFKQAGQGSLRNGWYNTDFMKIFSKVRRAASNTLGPTVKATLLAMEYLNQQQQSTLYGKAQNLRRKIKRHYDDVFESADVIAMPTMPGKPLRHDPELSRVQKVIRTFPPNKNTCPFVLTDHPSITVPCGSVDGLPVGMMLVGESFDEYSILKVAHAYERCADVDW